MAGTDASSAPVPVTPVQSPPPVEVLSIREEALLWLSWFAAVTVPPLVIYLVLAFVAAVLRFVL